MREAIGNAFAFQIVIIILFIIMMMLIGSVAYSKAYKVKNMIVNVIEKYDGFTDKALEETTKNLQSIGYYINIRRTCPDLTNEEGQQAETIYNGQGQYRYCVYRFNTVKGNYYQVIAYMHFDIPIIGDFIEFPIKGESRIIYEDLQS